MSNPLVLVARFEVSTTTDEYGCYTATLVFTDAPTMVYVGKSRNPTAAIGFAFDDFRDKTKSAVSTLREAVDNLISEFNKHSETVHNGPTLPPLPVNLHG